MSPVVLSSLCSPGCHLHGICVRVFEDFFCVCDRGYSGVACDVAELSPSISTSSILTTSVAVFSCGSSVLWLWLLVFILLCVIGVLFSCASHFYNVSRRPSPGAVDSSDALSTFVLLKIF